MGATTERIDTQTIKASVNLAEYAERFTTLHRESATEQAGPCPKCGGNDRFHVTADWFFCRECHEKRGDVIEFVQWLEGCTFTEACNRLSGGGLPAAPVRQVAPVKKRTPAPWASAKWQQSAERLVSEAHERLFTEGQGEQGRAYLEGRGLHSGTWLTYRLGFAQAALPGTQGRKRAPAVVMPWIVQDKVRAIRYRFLELQHYTAEGQERQEKQTAEAGSGFSGVFFGGHAIRAEGTENKVLVLLEGEINAMSVLQVASSAGVDAVSVGSESARLTPTMVQALTSRYEQIFCWFDKPERARGAQAALPGSVPLQSPGGKDANDLLQAEALGGFLAYLRWQHTPAERLAELHGSLLSAARLWNGIDTGTAQVLTKLGEHLSRAGET